MRDVALLAQTVAQFRQVWKKSWNATQITVGTSFWTPFHSHVQNYIVSQPLKRNVYGEVVRIDSTITLHLSVRAMKSQVLHAGEIWNWIVCPEVHSWEAEHSLVHFLMHDVLSLVKASQTCVSILDISPFLTMKIRISFTLKKLSFHCSRNWWVPEGMASEQFVLNSGMKWLMRLLDKHRVQWHSLPCQHSQGRNLASQQMD